LGAVPVFADIDPVTFAIAPSAVESRLSQRTKAIIPVHLYGQCADMTALMALARRRNVYVIEDAAQSVGAAHGDQPAGSMGHIGCFSFYPTKNLGGLGDGGLLTSNDAHLADQLRLLANHGMRQRYYHEAVGINSRLDSLQAAALAVKLQSLDRWTAQRQAAARRYQNLLRAAGLGACLGIPVETSLSRHVWNQFTIRIPGAKRHLVRRYLTDRGIGSEIYYPVPMHRQRCFESLGWREGSLPQTEAASREVLSLPIFPEISERQQKTVVDALASAMYHLVGTYRAAA
jgi:dTDP-4-amino-4,6-dideoxygalactose transaminase